MKTRSTKFSKVVIAGFISVATLGLVRCTDTVTTAPANPPMRVVHEPTALYSVPGSENSTTTTTQYGNGAVEKQTTTNYNPPYTTMGPPNKTTVVPAAP